MTYHIPIGNKVLNIKDGGHEVQVNGQLFRALLDLDVHFNLLTNHVCQAAALEAREINNEADPGSSLVYCPEVPIVMSPSPPLPDMFIVVDRYIPGGYDMILGKPWMMNIKFRHKDSLFDHGMNMMAENPRWIQIWSALTSQGDHTRSRWPFRRRL